MALLSHTRGHDRFLPKTEDSTRQGRNLVPHKILQFCGAAVGELKHGRGITKVFFTKKTVSVLLFQWKRQTFFMHLKECTSDVTCPNETTNLSSK